MVRYRDEEGRVLVLAYHTQEEWADEVAARLRELGCSGGYVEAVAGRIRRSRAI